MSRFLRIILIVILIGMLALIRKFSEAIFYDPLTPFFKHDYLVKSMPDIEFIPFFLNLFFRYLINSLVSLAIIYLAFPKRDLIIFLVWIYIVGFAIFVIPYYFIITNYTQENYLMLFYVRRFLIQPILLLLLLPAFYYQKLTDH
ncbi:MAG: exosortase F system-associated protein [Flavobacteriaceae bacterium]|nr:exosortase F system-associated protein [Flavobacteriaceae bacterium]